MNKLTFINTNNTPLKYYPIPASKSIPDWYKQLSSYVNNEKKPSSIGTTSGTIKKCMPVFDVLTAGYLIISSVDIYVSKNEEGYPWFTWSNDDYISFHPIEQAPNHPKTNGFEYPKFVNPWGIKTPKGYSTLFIQPTHRESQFTILPGIVDTDKYVSPVNFPFVMNDPSWEGLIPVGTPIAQVIPIKRNKWKLHISSDVSEINVTNKLLLSRFFDRYKTFFWNKKQYS
jgi:hypothetical protein